MLFLNNKEDATITHGNSNLIIINNLASDQKQQQLSSPNWFFNLITNSCPGRCSWLWFGMVMMVKLIFDRISALLLQSGTQVIFFMLSVLLSINGHFPLIVPLKRLLLQMKGLMTLLPWQETVAMDLLSYNTFPLPPLQMWNNVIIKYCQFVAIPIIWAKM